MLEIQPIIEFESERAVIRAARSQSRTSMDEGRRVRPYRESVEIRLLPEHEERRRKIHKVAMRRGITRPDGSEFEEL